MPASTQFQVGRTYWCRSICDHDCKWQFTVHARTEKTITITVHAKPTRRKVRVQDDCEVIDPLGRYSMSPILSAARAA